ncbi:50S ribosomal protein L30 [Desulfovibrio legallii]|jgi:large subunit ribosomal protein L30|uniref:50S ribosomal protein L30 n=2 Tax=Desulfovibrio legallii TaxID=571438 RepID=A0A6H3FFT8_9BACT|nr:50S ribosomal protein L30 [Desulfovibrio legallii]RHH21844.1 50S ribosomal protein L30 [Desulfovibrio sp. AM18-2]TBH81468.1 50S ribosomal protein L30 [Desulfovibrio legallii]CAI3233922.1 LSU ribosomal protein L30p (L7e) [Desulfovibrio diazotrophicus]SDF71869.1 LSU ribosomal protein L30P [Desulfovibrio legallii]
MAAEIKVKLVRSRIGATPAQRKLLDALGLKRREKVRTFKDTPAIRGIIAKVPHMVAVVE